MAGPQPLASLSQRSLREGQGLCRQHQREGGAETAVPEAEGEDVLGAPDGQPESHGPGH